MDIINSFLEELKYKGITEYRLESFNDEKSLEWINEFGDEVIVSFSKDFMIYSSIINGKSSFGKEPLNKDSFETILKLIKEVLNETDN